MNLVLALIVVLAIAAVLRTPTHKEDFPFLLVGALAAAGGAGAGGLSFMSSGAKWSSGARPGNVVSFYKDINFQGARKDYALGAVQNSLSKGKFGIGLYDKENDTYSSLQVPPGLQVQVWADNDAKGQMTTFTAGGYSNLGEFGFNDKISSLKVTANASKCNPPGGLNTQFTTRVLTNGVWKCPLGWTDTGCSWEHGANGKKQCSR